MSLILLDLCKASPISVGLWGKVGMTPGFAVRLQP